MSNRSGGSHRGGREGPFGVPSLRVRQVPLALEEGKRIVVAVPVAAQRTCDEFKHEVDEIICLKSPPSFDAVGLWYENFSQLTDEDVRDLLRRASQSSAAGSDRGARVA